MGASTKAGGVPYNWCTAISLVRPGFWVEVSGGGSGRGGGGQFCGQERNVCSLLPMKPPTLCHSAHRPQLWSTPRSTIFWGGVSMKRPT